ncbi:hypothetical protein J6590_080679 [Homalodisca vitripennis]|nr:hypothetical protein J6590_080679 [Homalodisca vitripennis]
MNFVSVIYNFSLVAQIQRIQRRKVVDQALPGIGHHGVFPALQWRAKILQVISTLCLAGSLFLSALQNDALRYT